MVDENVEKKIEEYLNGSPEKIKKVMKFLKNEKNGDYNIILEASVNIDETFEYIVDNLGEEADEPEVLQESAPVAAGKGSRRVRAIADCANTQGWNAPSGNTEKIEEIYKPDDPQKSACFAAKDSVKTRGAVPDFTRLYGYTVSHWVIQIAINFSGKFVGAVIGAAFLPGIGTVIGAVYGGDIIDRLSTSLTGSMQGRQR